MTHKRTGSDDIKDFLIHHPDGGGRAQDWKRLSKHGDPDGSVVRVFQNAALGKTLTVIESPAGIYGVSKGTAPAAASAKGPAPVSPDAPLLTPFLDTDPVHNRAADEYIALFKAGAMRDEEDRMEELAKQAGKALANRFVFALDLDNYGGEDPHWCVTPACYWEQDECLSDDWLPGMGYILPRRAEETCESTYEISSPRDILAQAQQFFDAGFVWRRDMQDFIDPSVDQFIEAVERVQAKNSGSLPPPSAPRP